MRPILTALLRHSGLSARARFRALRTWFTDSHPVMLIRIPSAYPTRTSTKDDG
ncbi:hypothetical protein [Streptomyces yokosukanensis]|uniref:hypothetical protein n=1 Tax=Streptomyces yokosukanensis TaxID=67386 RepID=UPI000A5F1928|nr:hypothetical protein [Streptomyces yokosukanensis]